MAPKTAAPGSNAPATLPAPLPGEIRVWKWDLPKKKRKAVLDAVRILYARCVVCKGDDKAKNRPQKARWTDFAKALQGSLNRGLDPRWHVFVGQSLGFACKKRDHTMAVFRVDGIMIVCWRSPAIEVVDPPAEKAKTPTEEAGASETAAPAEAASSPAPKRKFHVVPPTTPPEDVAGTDRVIEVLQTTLEGMSATDIEDVQTIAQTVRAGLTTELGTIWHVAAGAEFVAVPAEDVDHFVQVMYGKTYVTCFRHSQTERARIDHEKILTAMPYFLLVIFCFGYMTLQHVCGEMPTQDRRLALWIRGKFCRADWEWDIGLVGAAALVLLFLSKRLPAFIEKGKQKIA
eukprot:TRINITY_DN62038_c0_g1_i1.p1 TRINITY_DN62038_c0_g1~~TRINITY_DN62038_c0_g1_i1.p1  ORF type:complete len:372 (+),score=78.60 TRINITY_DN62038_c0_g1_i1:84-1118(+)